MQVTRSAESVLHGADGSALRAAERPLDRLKGICDPRVGCKRWPEHLRLLNETTGEVIEGRCRATNLCPYCQARYVAETVEALLLDVAYGEGPSLYLVLTAREHLTRKQTHAHLRQLRTAARKVWPKARWFVQVEFQQRGALHLNLLVKGVPVEDERAFYELMTERWCARVDAEPVGQWIGQVAEVGGLAKYLGKRLGHGLKAEQAPPLGWKGHRTSQSRDYFNRPIPELREEARRIFRHRALIRQAIAAGHQAHDAELVAGELEAVAEASMWRLYSLSREQLAPGQQQRATREEVTDGESMGGTTGAREAEAAGRPDGAVGARATASVAPAGPNDGARRTPDVTESGRPDDRQGGRADGPAERGPTDRPQLADGRPHSPRPPSRGRGERSEPVASPSRASAARAGP